MAIPVSGGSQNLSTSSATANPDISRNAGNALLNLSFSDLLRGQMQSGTGANTPEFSSLPDTPPSRTPSPPETPREVSRASGDSSSTHSIASRPSQEPTRESAHLNSQNNQTEAEQLTKRPAKTQDTTPPQQANAETDKPAETGESIETSEPAETGKLAETGEKEITAGSNTTIAHSLQPQLTDIVISPDLPVMTDLPATIAALLGGIAGEIAESIPENEPAPEVSAQATSANNMGQPARHPEMSGNLPARAAAFTATQPDMGMEDNAECGGNDDQGTNPNILATPASRTPRQAVSADSTAVHSGTGNESSARINTAAAFSMMTNAANVLSAATHEGSGARTVPAAMTANAGEIPMLNPLRPPTQTGAALPQFTIPAGASQKAWAEEIGNRVMWMLGRAQSRAELILTPPLLGKVEVSIHLNGDQSTAQFLASSQSAREALEQAMPRLRELLAQAGINLGEASVNTSAEGQTQGGENTHRAGSHTTDIHDIHDDDGNTTGPAHQSWSRLDTGLINTFA